MNTHNIFQEKWETADNGKVIIRSSDNIEDYGVVCEVIPGKYQNQFANLIAAAPDLLRACRFALNSIKHGTLDNITYQILEDAIFKTAWEQK